MNIVRSTYAIFSADPSMEHMTGMTPLPRTLSGTAQASNSSSLETDEDGNRTHESNIF